MESKVIYDILNEGYTECSFIIDGFMFLIMILFIANFVRYYLSKDKKITRRNIIHSILPLIFYILFAIVWILLTYPPYRIAREFRIKNEYKIVTGRVRNIEVTYGKIPSQKFYVDNILFWVEDGGYHPGYNKTIQKGAPFYTGKCVRIWYAKIGDENAILRLEVLKDEACKE